MNFHSSDYTTYPPDKMTVDSCTATVNFPAIQYDGGTVTSGVASHLPDFVDDMIRNKLQEVARKALCDQVRPADPKIHRP